MVTCKERQCRKWAHLDSDGYCPIHAKNSAHSNENEVSKCGACNDIVSNESDAKALQCDVGSCKVWYHLECTKISEPLYDLMNENGINEDDGIRWICPNCSVSDPIISVTDSENPEISDPIISLTASENPALQNGRAICKKLKHGSCPYGISGKTDYKGKTCEFHHPKLCKKYTRYGSGGRYGCKMTDKNCRDFHPILCRNSVNKRKCLNPKCTYTHLKGTVRKEFNDQIFPPSMPYVQKQMYKSGVHHHSAWNRNPPLHQNADLHQSARLERLNSIYHSNDSQPFLDPVAVKPSPPQLASIQAQVNRLEEMLKEVLKNPLKIQPRVECQGQNWTQFQKPDQQAPLRWSS